MQSPHFAPVAYKVTEFYNNDAGESGLYFRRASPEHGEL